MTNWQKILTYIYIDKHAWFADPEIIDFSLNANDHGVMAPIYVMFLPNLHEISEK